ncbi:copper chaperone PCu(A)C [Erythrobacter sp. 3-20A1M]|uniref:copper chaperone PCu(A)C n=1 Tax=Erythrobacter sp. 3-20A1M TaxID=2653850 RepID=UPI000C43E75C|nr:copper chaperone PCu(A)C [Erythrobacter sp. 3-20A1M]MAP70011.1 hypothetical protein [Erythrobacteraceae bacterium]QWC58163.1 copper chaperone PCu(A)C [Erythrobacter sp. 3-20A1M]
MSRQIFAAAALVLAVPTLAACGGDAPTEEAGVPGVTVSNARMVLAPVAGNPAAIYFDLSYDSDRPLALSRASVKGAESAVIHKYGMWNEQEQMVEASRMTLNKGETVKFEPGGLHVMAMNPSPELKAGGSTDMTLHFSGGKEEVVPVTIQAAGEDR